MLETPHVVVGALIATKVAHPALAIPLALGSHFVLDKLPHWNPHLYLETQKMGRPSKTSTTIALVDVGVALSLGLALAYQFSPEPSRAILILACSLASVLPDIVKWPYYYLRSRSKLLVRWVRFERSIQVNAAFTPGIITQVLVIFFSFFWFFN